MLIFFIFGFLNVRVGVLGRCVGVVFLFFRRKVLEGVGRGMSVGAISIMMGVTVLINVRMII